MLENPRRGLIYRDINLGSYGVEAIPGKGASES